MTNTFPTDKPAIHKAPLPRSGAPGRTSRVAKAAEEESRQITPLGLLHAFRRRWIPAVAVGLPLAVLAAVVLWELTPAPYESFATLKVLQYEPRTSTKQTGGYESNFLNYRDTQMAYMKSQPVLEAALRKPEVSQTETIKVLKYPSEYLAKKLKVNFMESDEFVQIGLEGSHPRELTTIVNAVKDAYMNEVVYAERNQKATQLEKLQTLCREKTQELKNLESHIDELAEGLGTTDARANIMNMNLLQQDLTDIRRDLRKVKDDLDDEEQRRNARIRADLPPDALVSVDVRSPSDRDATLLPGAAVSGVQRLNYLRGFIRKTERTLAPGRRNSSLERAKQELAALEGRTSSSQPGGPGAVMSPLRDLERTKSKP